MVQIDFYTIVIKDLIRRKFSTALTVFAISLGILSIFVILSITQSFNESIEGQLSEFGADKIFIQKTGGSEIVFDDQLISEIERNSNIRKVYGYAMENLQFQNGRDFISASVLASNLDEDFFEDSTIDIVQGQAPRSNSDFVIVMGPLIAKEGFDRELRVGQSLEVSGTKFKIVGITKEFGNPQDDNTVYMQYDVLERFGLANNYDMLVPIVVNTQNIENTKSNLEIFFEREFGENRVSVLTSKDLLDQLNTITSLITGVLGGIGFVSLIVGALGIINTMFVIVQEKIKDIGILKSVGAKNREILQLFMFQSSLFGILGAVFGIFLGSLSLLLIQLVLNQLGFTFLEIEFFPVIIFQMLLFGSVVGAIAGFIPSYIASRIDVVEALRK